MTNIHHEKIARRQAQAENQRLKGENVRLQSLADQVDGLRKQLAETQAAEYAARAALAMAPTEGMSPELYAQVEAVLAAPLGAYVAGVPSESQRMAMGQAASDFLAQHCEDGELCFDHCDANNIDALVSAVLAVAPPPGRSMPPAAWANLGNLEVALLNSMLRRAKVMTPAQSVADLWPSASPAEDERRAQASIAAMAGEHSAPYSNCRFRICDLPGQCLDEGECHHPAVPAALAQQFAAPKEQSPDPNVEAVRKELLERSKVGLRKYGTTTADNPLSLVEWLTHLQQELMDAAVYVEAAKAQATQAATDVLAERHRQATAEGWTPGHDDRHAFGELAEAAAAYASEAAKSHAGLPMCWPWSASWWKPSTPRRNLVKAGALILAEIERLDRAAIAQQVAQEGGA